MIMTQNLTIFLHLKPSNESSFLHHSFWGYLEKDKKLNVIFHSSVCVFYLVYLLKFYFNVLRYFFLTEWVDVVRMKVFFPFLKCPLY